MSEEQHVYHVGDEVMIIATITKVGPNSVVAELCDGGERTLDVAHVTPYFIAVQEAETALIEYVLRVRTDQEDLDSDTMDELADDLLTAIEATTDPANRKLAIALKALEDIKSQIGKKRGSVIFSIVEKAFQDLKKYEIFRK